MKSDMNEQSPYRLIIHKPEADEYFPLPLGMTTLGREANRELVLKHPMVSRLHAQIVCTQSTCEITDMESANGTVINDQALSPHTPFALQHQDRIQIGPFEIVLEIVPQQIEPSLEAIAAGNKSGPVEFLSPFSTKASTHEPIIQPQDSSSTAGVPFPQPPGGFPPSPPPTSDGVPFEEKRIPSLEGLAIYSTHLINYLPDIYRSSSPDKFMERFLGLFESIWLPIEYTVDNFDLFLDPRTAPTEFLPWLAQWFDISIDFSLKEAQIRAFLAEAHEIFASRGTKKALIRLLEIFTGCTPDIIEFGESLAPHTFKVRFNVPKTAMDQHMVERLINANKPAYTAYQLEFSR